MSAGATNARLDPRAWPLVVKAPLLVALLMFVVSATITNQVLNRLEQNQQTHLDQLASAYLDALSTALLPPVVRDDVWEAFDTLDRSRDLFAGLHVNWTVVTSADGLVLAASDPKRFASRSRLPDSLDHLASVAGELKIDKSNQIAHLRRALIYQGREIGVILAEADIQAQLAERRDIFWTLIATNFALTLALALTGVFVVRQMLKPLGQLSMRMEESRLGQLQPVPVAEISRQSVEFQRLFRHYNALVAATSERESLAASLAEEEKLASLGRLASGMAHEINNPLGGMFNALDSLRRHGDKDSVRTTSIRLIEQGLSGIRDLVRSTLTTYRADRPLRDLTPADLDDLRLLVKPEAKRLKLRLDWQVDIPPAVAVPAVPVRDSVLNLLLNACKASVREGRVSLTANIASGHLVLEVGDSGPGLADNLREYVARSEAGAVPLDQHAGLGLWIVKRLCAEIGARIEVAATGKTGTVIRMSVPISGEVALHAA